jgi:hypothetical protein
VEMSGFKVCYNAIDIQADGLTGPSRPSRRVAHYNLPSPDKEPNAGPVTPAADDAVDSAQLPRIDEMTANATARLAEAKGRAWLGEVAALEDSLKHLRQRRLEAEQLSL